MRTPQAHLTIALIVALLGPISASAQDTPDNEAVAPRPHQREMSEEEQKAAFLKHLETVIQHYIEEMGDQAPTQDQLESFIKTLNKAQIAQVTLIAEFRSQRGNQTERPNRDDMLAFRSELEKVNTQLLKEMKELLEKKQFKAFKKAKEKIEPQSRQRPGGGGSRGGGSRGGGGGRRGGGF